MALEHDPENKSCRRNEVPYGGKRDTMETPIAACIGTCKSPDNVCALYIPHNSIHELTVLCTARLRLKQSAGSKKRRLLFFQMQQSAKSEVHSSLGLHCFLFSPFGNTEWENLRNGLSSRECGWTLLKEQK